MISHLIIDVTEASNGFIVTLESHDCYKEVWVFQTVNEVMSVLLNICRDWARDITTDAKEQVWQRLEGILYLLTPEQFQTAEEAQDA